MCLDYDFTCFLLYSFLANDLVHTYINLECHITHEYHISVSSSTVVFWYLIK